MVANGFAEMIELFQSLVTDKVEQYLFKALKLKALKKIYKSIRK
jgi:hypothetical protein